MHRKQVNYEENNMEDVHNQTKQLIKLAKNINCEVPLQSVGGCELPDVQPNKSMSKLYNVHEDICLEEFDPYWSNYFKSQKDSTANYLYNIDVYGPSKDPTCTSRNEPIPNELVRQRLRHITPIGVLNRDNMFHILNFILNIIRLPKERQMQWMQHFKSRKMLDNELLNYMQLIASHENSGLSAIQKDDFCAIVQELLRDHPRDFADGYFHPEHIFRKSLMDMDPYEMAYLNYMFAKDDLNKDEYIYLANFVHQLQEMKDETRDNFLKYLYNKGVLPSPHFSSVVYAMGQKTKPFDEDRARILVKELEKAMNIAAQMDVAETPATKLPPKREGVITSIDIDPMRLRKAFNNLMQGGIPNIVRLNDMKSFIRDMQIFSKFELERMLSSLKDANILNTDQLEFLYDFISSNNLSLTPEKRRQLLDAIRTVNKSPRTSSNAGSISKREKETGADDLSSNKLLDKLKKIDETDAKIAEAKVPSADIKTIDQLTKEEKAKDKSVEKSKSDEKKKDKIAHDEKDEQDTKSPKRKSKKLKGKILDKKNELIVIESGDSGIDSGDVGVDGKAGVQGKVGVDGKVDVQGKAGVDGKAGVGDSAAKSDKIDVGGKLDVGKAGGKPAASDKLAAAGTTVVGDVEDVKPKVEKLSADKKRSKTDAVKFKTEAKDDIKKETKADTVTPKRKIVTMAESDDLIEVIPKGEIKKIKVDDEHDGKKGKGKTPKHAKELEDESAPDSKSKRLPEKTPIRRKSLDITDLKDNLFEKTSEQLKTSDRRSSKDDTTISKKGGKKSDMAKMAEEDRMDYSQKGKGKVGENGQIGGKIDRDQESTMDQDRYSNYGEDTKSILGDIVNIQGIRPSGVKEIDDKLFAFVKNSQYRMYKDSEDYDSDLDDRPDYSYMFSTRGTTFTSVLDSQDESSFCHYRTPVLRPPNVFITTSDGSKVPLIHFRMLFFHFSTRKGPSKHIVSIKDGHLILR